MSKMKKYIGEASYPLSMEALGCTVGFLERESLDTFVVKGTM